MYDLIEDVRGDEKRCGQSAKWFEKRRLFIDSEFGRGVLGILIPLSIFAVVLAAALVVKRLIG